MLVRTPGNLIVRGKTPVTFNSALQVFGATMEAKWIVWYRIERKATLSKRM